MQVILKSQSLPEIGKSLLLEYKLSYSKDSLIKREGLNSVNRQFDIKTVQNTHNKITRQKAQVSQ